MHFPALCFFPETMRKNQLHNTQSAADRLREWGKNYPGPFLWVEVTGCFSKKSVELPGIKRL
jgi:hypothetical protein